MPPGAEDTSIVPHKAHAKAWHAPPGSLSPCWLGCFHPVHAHGEGWDLPQGLTPGGREPLLGGMGQHFVLLNPWQVL